MTTKAAVLTNNAAPSMIHVFKPKNRAAAVDKSGVPPPTAELVISMYATFSMARRISRLSLVFTKHKHLVVS
jgi:hypothetical protein